MKINTANVTYSSIVQIGENINKIEKETGDKYLKLHRGVMDVTTLDIDSLNLDLNLNGGKTQQYSGNDGSPELIETIKEEFGLEGHVVITPGGMAGLDLLIGSLGDETIWIPNYHWGSWNKILTTHGKEIKTFDDFKIDEFMPREGVVMLCYPSNPTGYCPDLDVIKKFLLKSKDSGVTIVLDLPYYYLFNDINDGLSDLFLENVIVVSSFSKSIGLSGYRVGYIATKNEQLYQTLRIRSLYKYNSISTLPQHIINELLKEKTAITEYKKKTVDSIKKNIMVLEMNGLLFDEYPQIPTGPFAVVNISYDELLKNKISSVPLSKFTLNKQLKHENCSRISGAVDHKVFWEYFEKILVNEKTTL
jgi:aspartate/methionine/tyrosine aminotransferase